MSKINWRIRIKNKTFWMTLVPALMLSAQRIALIAGISFDLDEKQAILMSALNSIFVVLAILGIVTDPTVEGLGDSQRALVATVPLPCTDCGSGEAQEAEDIEGGEDDMTAEEIVDDILRGHDTGQVDAQ